MRLSEDFMRELHDRNDIASIAREYVELKRSGSSYMCRCPFHSEKTPSCSISPDKGLFHCFGCGAGGDVVTFIRLIENLDYMDAVRFLAQKAGMPMPEDKDDGSAKKRQRLYEMNREAGKYFHKRLFSPEGAVGLDYLRRRGLSEHTIRRFGLGYADDDYHALHYYMKSLGFSDYELTDGSLLATNNNKIYDKFRNRVMFPIFDTRKNVAAFGGRTLSEDKNIPKYLNSAETPIFHKSDMLFAMNIAKSSKADYFILCEGYMDVISLHQAGFDSAVASLGTSLTAQQANMISRLGKKEVILSYDSDGAGQAAASRGINLLSEAGVRARVLKMSGAKDPDEFIKKYGAEAFGLLIEKSGSAIAYEMDKLAAGLDLNSDDGRAAYLKKAVAFLAQISNDIDRSVYISRAARESSIPAETVKAAVEREMARSRGKAQKKLQNTALRPAPDRINPGSARTPREEKAERGIICYLFRNPEALGKISSELKRDFVTAFNKRVYEFLAKTIADGENPDISLFNEEFDAMEMGRILQIVSDDMFANDATALADFIDVINNYGSGGADKRYGEMSDEELLKQAQKLKEKRK
ncbi:MAG: DNA primase [Lachnospiraceae bacterium]|nr:DNA primase [Ruminococcus sp.]MCM1275276.1 DNA primase [Lachnospiraceae bacterium]